jgi:hypothetical protein
LGCSLSRAAAASRHFRARRYFPISWVSKIHVIILFKRTPANVHLEPSDLGIDVLRAELQQRCQELHRVHHRFGRSSKLYSVWVIVLLLRLTISLLRRLVWLILLGKGLSLSLLSFLSCLLRGLLSFRSIVAICITSPICSIGQRLVMDLEVDINS